MKAIEFEGQNQQMMPPSGWQRGTCGQLPIFRHDGVMVSVWKPDEADLKALADGAHVLLHIWSDVLPPVAVTIQKMTELP